jgi:Cd2+/Zn2+-exporting ATPase
MTNRRSTWRTPFAYRTYFGGAIAVVALLVQWFTGSAEQAGWLALRLDPAGVLFTLAAAIAGSNFAAAAVRAVRRLRLDMNFLMSAAMVGAVLIGEPFEAATLAVLFSFAELLEQFAVDRGRRSIERLVQLAPERADRIVASGSLESVPVSELRVGDRIRIRPGDKVAADGQVVAGSSSINEATITGESLPRSKQVGDKVFAGTLNADGSLDIEVSVDAVHSTLGRIVQLVREAEARRAPIERFVERFARVYTPAATIAAVLVMAVPPLLFGGAAVDWFVRGLTLLVVACPCALVIATPVTIMSALTSAARQGILIKGGEYVEALGSMRALAVDKTGTLTKGTLKVEAYLADRNEDELLSRIASVEARSEHPVARAIVRFAQERGVAMAADVADFSAVTGKGVKARVAGQPILIGAVSFGGPGPSTPPPNPAPGTALVFAQTGDGLNGWLTVRDEVRPEAADVVRTLHSLGIRPVVMLSGDAASAAKVIGWQVGIDDIRAPLLPEDKVRAVRELREAYGTVGMLGDGVNDAPAIAEASLGLAMGAAGSPATLETADVALMADDLTKLPVAIDLARRARRIMRFNIGVALGLKGLLALGAITGRVNLAVAVLLGDMGASLVVTINALRLARSNRAM